MSNVGGVGSNSNTSNSASSASSSSSSDSNSAINAQVQSEYNTFLTILTTELQNQDPTSPLDTNQFTSQLVQFSSLEQNLQTNSLLQQLVSNSTQGQVSGALGYLGHTVQATGNTFEISSASDSDSSSSSSNAPTLSYTIASTAQTATMDIVNSSGQTVRQISVPTTAGANSITFDGNDSSGKPLADGTYTFTVQAGDAKGNAINTTTFETGMVTGIDTSGGTVNLHMGSLIVPAANVVQVIS